MTDVAKHNDRQWQVIEKVLHRRQSPTIFWITCDDYLYREQLVDIFESRFPELQHQKLSLKKFSESSFQPFFKNNLSDDFLSTNDIKKAVHLVDVESRTYPRLAEDRSTKVPNEHFIRILNFEREILFNSLPFYIVFWSDALSMKQVQRYAPDFYDWVSYKFNFESYPDEEKQSSKHEITHESGNYLSEENVTYNRISRRLHTLETVPKENINDRFSLLRNVAQDYIGVNDYQKAEEVIKELLKLKALLPEQIASIKLLQADVFSELSRLNEAENAYEEALNIRRGLARENPGTYLPDVAMTLNNLAVLQKTKNQFPQALANYEEALKIRRDLAKENPRAYLPYVANTLNNLAVLQKAKNEFPEALDNYQEALNVYRVLAKENPRAYLPDVAMTLNNLGVLHSDKNEFPQALAYYDEALKVRKELAIANPRTFLPDVATTLNNLAILHSDKNEFPQALTHYEEALNIRRVLAKENPRTNLPYVATILNNLAVLYSDKNEFPLALMNYEEALSIYRVLAEKNPRTYLPDVAMTLNNLANLQNARNELLQASTNYEEALAISRGLAEENSRTYLPDVAMTLNNLANLHSDKNEFPQALDSYEEALKIYRGLAKENPQTYLPDVAMTLNNLAILYSDKNEFPQALSSHEEALNIRRKLAKENPRRYEINYAKSLILGVLLFKKEQNDLSISEEILNKYENVPHAKDLLNWISEIRSEEE